MPIKTFSYNGRLLPIEQAQVPLSLVEYSYGYGVYENIRYANGILYFLADHLERLAESARVIGLEHEFTAEFVASSVRELVAAAPDHACNLKILLIGGRTAADAQLFILALNPLFPDRKLYRDGAAVITRRFERAFPHAKTLNMLQSYLAYRDAARVGAYDALLINRAGNITEGTRTNFFGIKGKTIVSPPEDEILLGVTRKAMIVAAEAAGFNLEQRDIPADSLGSYDGVFITSTSSKIVPIRSIDGDMVSENVPENLRELMRAFDEFLDSSRGEL
ncbi:MAG TPA: aminotransferase class IV [Candidatus Saccharimonadia bacterium]|jgi:branched-subunit amino acid aminotransferase/4-amino-4-deoxychorismate lyase|nr:aminotransferase class IV [Candidatus Saccharimonadia bacterium]